MNTKPEVPTPANLRQHIHLSYARLVSPGSSDTWERQSAKLDALVSLYQAVHEYPELGEPDPPERTPLYPVPDEPGENPADDDLAWLAGLPRAGHPAGTAVYDQEAE